MEFEGWQTPFTGGKVFLVDLSWGRENWELTTSDGKKYQVAGDSKHRNNDLIARIFHKESESLFEVHYDWVSGFRCLDEHGLDELWGSRSKGLGCTFRVKGHGWHRESPLTFFMGNKGEWSHMIVTQDDCLEVVCADTPMIRLIGRVAPSP